MIFTEQPQQPYSQLPTTENNPLSINKKMDKLWYIHADGILLSNQKGWTCDIHNSLRESQNHSVKLKEARHQRLDKQFCF